MQCNAKQYNAMQCYKSLNYTTKKLQIPKPDQKNLSLNLMVIVVILWKKPNWMDLNSKSYTQTRPKLDFCYLSSSLHTMGVCSAIFLIDGWALKKHLGSSCSCKESDSRIDMALPVFSFMYDNILYGQHVLVVSRFWTELTLY